MSAKHPNFPKFSFSRRVVPQNLVVDHISFDNTPATEFPYLNDSIDPDGLNQRFDHMSSGERSGGVLTVIFDYTGQQFVSWAEVAGFEDVQIQHLNGPASIWIAHKR